MKLQTLGLKACAFGVFTLSLAACSGSGESTTSRNDDGDGGADVTGDGGADEAGTTGGETAADASTGAADEGTSGDGGGEEVTIVGTWVSEGDNLAPFLVSEAFQAKKVVATFDAVSYTAITTDVHGQEYTLTGVYEAAPTDFGNIHTITLEMTTPMAGSAQGIYEIDTSVNPPTMRYEILDPALTDGEIPDPAKGFGQTSHGPAFVQVYVRQ